MTTTADYSQRPSQGRGEPPPPPQSANYLSYHLSSAEPEPKRDRRIQVSEGSRYSRAASCVFRSLGGPPRPQLPSQVTSYSSDTFAIFSDPKGCRARGRGDVVTRHDTRQWRITIPLFIGRGSEGGGIRCARARGSD